MQREYKLEIELVLSDRDRSFDEILESIYEVIKQRNGVRDFKLLGVGYNQKN